MNATIRSVVAVLAGEHRVFFDIPATGFGPDELDALIVAATRAREQLTATKPTCHANTAELPEPCG